MVRRPAALLAAALLLAATGCGSTGSKHETGSELVASHVCPGGVTNNGVVQCDRFFATGDAVRLPRGSTTYGAIDYADKKLVSSRGSYQLSAGVKKRLEEPMDDSSMDATDIASTRPYAQDVYAATLDGSTVTALKPAVHLGEDALLTSVFGGKVLEGTIATYDDGGYDDTRTLPIRVQVAPTAQDSKIAATIVNATTGVTASDGSCLPALNAKKAIDPLRDVFTKNISLERFPSMHAPFDDELLLAWNDDVSNMGGGYYPSAATVLGLDDLRSTWETFIHGTPTAGPAVTLAFVTGGGEPCTA